MDEAACTNVGELAFIGFNDKQIYSVESNGTSLRRLTGGEKNSRPAWSPDGKRIAFIAESPSGSSKIMLMNADGSDVQVRTSSGYKSASWSPDGKFLAVSTEGYYESSIDVIPVDPAAGVVRHLSGMGKGPSWSPDGKKILYTRLSGDDGYDQLFVINADGSGDRALTVTDPASIVSSSWAPDGGKVAFAKCFGPCALYVIDVDGSNVKQLAGLGSVAGVDWSPDGKWIAVSSYGAPGYSDYSTNSQALFYVPADGGALRLIALNASMPVWRR
jgi:Tol biopolymer transport system component